jgi:hypothetical protein
MKELNNNRVQAEGRLAYRQPEIIDLGSVVDLTEANGTHGKADGVGYSGPHGS